MLPPSLVVFFSSIPSCKGKKTKLNLLFTYPYSFSNFKTYQLLECLFTLYLKTQRTVTTTQTTTGTRLARKDIVFSRLNFLQGLDQGLPHWVQQQVWLHTSHSWRVEGLWGSWTQSLLEYLSLQLYSDVWGGFICVTISQTRHNQWKASLFSPESQSYTAPKCS